MKLRHKRLSCFREVPSLCGTHCERLRGEAFAKDPSIRGRIELYLIHREDPLIDPWETGRALLDLKKEGMVREIGVSNFDPFKFEALNKAVGGQQIR